MPASTATQLANEVMQVKRLRASAVLPVRGSQFAAGFDLAAAEAVVVGAGDKALVKTGLSLAIPANTYARVAPRSGLAAKKMIDVGAGVVDYDYRGEVGVILFNHGKEDFAVAAGDRIAQLVLEKITMVPCREVESLDETTRGEGGFGSTGVADKVANEPSLKRPKMDEEDIKCKDAAMVSSQHAIDSKEIMQVKRLRPTAVMPVRGSEFAAGFDLSASEAAVVSAGDKAVVKTGLSIAIPAGTYARVAPRSGLAAKKMIDVGAGVVDYDYRGEVGVVVFNHGKEDFTIAAGDRIAQLILEQIAMAPCVEVESLDETMRGGGGFGSTGVTEKVAETSRVDSADPASEKVPQEAANSQHSHYDNNAMQVKRLRPSAEMPVRGSELAAGFDLAAAETAVVNAGGKAVVKTGLSIAIPAGTYARVAPRSGLAAKKMIDVGAGVVDYDYRGEIGVVLFNHGKDDFTVEAGDRVAQLILEKISMAPCMEMESLDDTIRGEGGFGSTGVTKQVPDTSKSESA